MASADKLQKITRQLYPTGRAFRMAHDSYLHGLHRALSYTEGEAYDNAASILKSMLPDNDVFSSADATDWERRLAMVTNLATPLADRKAAIERKMAAPGTQPAKGHYLYIQRQLQAAGFDVYVHENMIPVYPDQYDTHNPADLNPNILSQTQHGDVQHGWIQSAYINNIVVNSIDNDVDRYFNLGGSLRCTFFIGGQVIGTYATVPSSRETEFRQLILSLKQVQLAAILFITYT